jgi:hypothetical protein
MMMNKSEGLGDTIAKITSAARLDKLAEKIAEIAGAEDCGCKKRQAKLNKMFPYTPSKKITNSDNPNFPLRK